MRFLADESCDFAVVRALRAAGHDVSSVAQGSAGLEDRLVLDLAFRERRILVTEDKDFGQLAFAHLHETAGVILVRFPARSRSAVGSSVVSAASVLHGDARGVFLVVQPGRVRVSRSS